ncbi:hypothetical protein BC628DRAFT_1318915 [Trametes gibbosa]|nr:hypothetical protein BC628DRAFT_1318915 [Trametes gibbosa]
MSWFIRLPTDEFLILHATVALLVLRRTGEKTKWVPVPPEELQFERPNRTQQQRHRLSHADRNPRKSDAASAAPSTSSGQGSQQQSRAHSSTGVRPPPSHAGSVSHSQAQSRTGSVHSSPRHPSVRGGGRRLPDDTGALGFAANRSVRSSGPNSPATYAQPQPLPPSEFIPGSRPFVNTNVSGRDVSSLGAISDSNAADMPPPGAYYPPPGPPFGVSPYHSPRPAGSPALNPYALPSVPYPGQPGIPTPIPIPGYGTPPYPMYPPYPYAYGQPYMYWPPPHAPAPQGISIASPTNLIQPGDPRLPPPTLVARPPPPSESEAVAGYRDVGFALPPPAEQSHNGQVEGDSVERGRARELSFGTVALEGATSPSGSPSSSAVLAPEAREVAANDKKAYEAARVDPTAGDNKVNGENANGKTFAVFSIGVAPGEPGPARLRSRTRTHSKGAVTSVSVANSSIRETLSATGGPDAEDISALGEAVANVIDLTDSKATLAFGTTQQADDITSEGTSAEPPASSTVPDVMPSQLQATTVPMMSPYAQPFAPLIVIPSGPINGMASAPSPSSYSRQPPTSATEDDLAVRDYGYGFGRGGPQQGFPPQRDDRPFRDRRDFQPQGDNYGRPRRGSYGQGFDRGSFGGRRGRGLSGGYGGRGYSNRSFAGGRGGYGNQGQPRQQAYVPQPPPPPPPPQPDLNGYYAPPMATYIPSPYDSYPYAVFPPPPPPPQMVASTAPLPVPLSQLLFPLDSTRYYLLGQLEYYLSVQNMEQDFFLRQQMDSLGWIPIGLIASFNRVRSLTTDSQLVTDVLTLSSLVEVRDGYVRMHQWQQYVLPTARKSSLEDDSVYPASGALAFAAPQGAEPHQGAEEENATAMQTHEGEEDEDEDVEFVM